MKTIGIIAEYNPFHTGHMYQISESRKKLGGETAVVCVMSGNWTQQANCAITDKWTRAKLALSGGADLVLELPTPWATASAERFARGGVSLLVSTGVIDVLSFGSECGDTEGLKSAAQCLDSDDYSALLRKLLLLGKPYAVCRQEAVEALSGAEIGSLLRHPNNNLGVEYIRALNALNSSIVPLTVPRIGAGHASPSILPSNLSLSTGKNSRLFHDRNPFLSATAIRHHLAAGEWNLMEPYLPNGSKAIFGEIPSSLSSLHFIERAILSKLRSMTAEDWSSLPDSATSEGLPQRLADAARTAASLDEFFCSAATKRYTHARLRRLVLWAYLGLTRRDFGTEFPPYLRVLGSNETGRGILKAMKKNAVLPIITKPAQVRTLDENCRSLFELESRCTDLYDLCFSHIPHPAREWTTSPILL